MWQRKLTISSVGSNFLTVVFCVIILTLVGCKGPKIRTCISKPQWGGFECHDARDKRDYNLSITQAQGYECKDFSAENDILAYCEAEKCLKDLPYIQCQIQNLTFYCTQPDGSQYTLPFAETENYICRPPEDEEMLINYCNAKAGCV